MLQVRNVTKVWADWLVYGVRYDGRHRHIEWLFAYADNGDSVGAKQTFSREAAITAIEHGTTFCTIYGAPAGKWNFGAKLHVITSGGTKYLTTTRDSTPADNLGRLPER
jgi:hypothetical protein